RSICLDFLDLVHDDNVVSRNETDLLAGTIKEQAWGGKFAARNDCRVAADVVEDERLARALGCEFNKIHARLNQRDDTREKKHLLRQRVALRVELTARHEKINPHLKSEFLPALGEIIEIHAGSLKGLELRHPNLPLFYFVPIGWDVLKCAETPHTGFEE